MSDLAQCCKGGADMAAKHSIEALLSSYASAMTIQDLQNALNIKARKARNLVLHGEIPAFKIAGHGH